MTYAAFLLGINVGKRSIKMADVKALMEKLGYTKVRTVLASGNVVFDAPKQKPDVLVKKLETAYAKHFGFTIEVIVRTMAEIEAVLNADPFKKTKVTKDIRLYVTFLSAKPSSQTPPKPTEAGYRIIKVTSGEAYSVLDLAGFSKIPDVMTFLKKAYGKRITTRNWNTVHKVAAL